MKLNNVIELDAFRKQSKNTPASDTEALLDYQAKLLGMDKLSLLEEMVQFQQERSKLGQLTQELILRGRHLFRALEDRAETEELRTLSKSYRRHLEFELSALKRG